MKTKQDIQKYSNKKKSQEWRTSTSVMSKTMDSDSLTGSSSKHAKILSFPSASLVRKMQAKGGTSSSMEFRLTST